MSDEDVNATGREKTPKPWRYAALKHYADYDLQMQPDLFVQSVEVARLAVELAKLERMGTAGIKKEPVAFIESAAALINAAAEAVAFHPSLRQDELLDAFMNGNRIPLSRLWGVAAKPMKFKMDDGSTWHLSPFTSDDPKGINQALKKHMRRMVEKGMAEQVTVDGVRESQKYWLLLRLAEGRGDVTAGVAFLERGYYECLAKLLSDAAAQAGPGKGVKWARRVYEAWIEAAAKAAAADMFDEWKEKGIPLVDFEAFADSQWLAYKAKGRKKDGQKSEGSEGTGEV